MTSKAINQNDLIDIIKANVDVVTDTLNIIKNSNIKSVYTSINAFKADAKLIFQSLDYITSLIIKDSSTLLKLSNAKHISIGYKNLHESLVYIKNINDLFLTYNDTKKSLELISDISVITDFMIHISKNIALMVLYLPLFSSFVASSPIIFSTFGIALQMIGKLTEVAKFSITRFITIKLFSMTARTMVKGFKTVLTIIKEVTGEMGTVKINPMKMLQILWCVNILSDIVGVMKSIHGFFLVRRMKIIRMAILQIVKTLNVIARARNINKATKNIFLYKLAIDSLFGLMLSLTVMAPIALLFVAISPIIMVCIYALAKVLDLIGFIARKTLTKKSTKGLRNLSIAILGITAIALTTIVLAKISWKVVLGIPAIILLLIGLIHIAVLVSVVMFVIKLFSSKRIIRRMTIFASTLLILTAIAGTLIVLSAVASIALIGMPNLLLFMAGVLLVSFSIWMLLKIVKHLTTLKIVGGLFILASLVASLIGVGYLMILLAATTMLLTVQYHIILLFMVEMLAFTWLSIKLLTLINKVVTFRSLLGLLYLGIIVGSMLATGYLLLQLLKMAKIITKGFGILLLFVGGLTLFAIAVGVLGFAVAAFGIYSVVIIAGLLLLTTVVGLVFVMGKMLIKIQNMKLDKDLLKYNIKTILDSTRFIIDALFNSEENKNNPSHKGWIPSVLNKYMKSSTDIMEAIMSVGFLAISLVSVSLLLLMAHELKAIQDINLDTNTIGSKVSSIVGITKTIIDTIFQKDNKETPKSNKGFLSDLIGSIFPNFKPIMKSIMSVGFLAISLASVGLVAMIATHLTTIQKLPSMSGIGDKVETIITAAKTVINSVFTSNDKGIGKVLKQIADNKKADLMLKSLLGTVETVDRCGIELMKIGQLDSSTIKHSSFMIDSIIAGINKISDLKINETDIRSKARAINNLNNTLKHIIFISNNDANNNEKIIGNYVKFVDKINSVKIDNLSKATSMFKEMARLSESINGNFEGLADSLNEKIAPLLEELRDMLTKIPDNIQDSTKNISQTIVNNADGSKGWTPDIIKQNMKNFDNTPNLSDLQEEQTKASYESKADNMRISELLQEILDVMTGNGAYPEGVKTN